MIYFLLNLLFFKKSNISLLKKKRIRDYLISRLSIAFNIITPLRCIGTIHLPECLHLSKCFNYNNFANAIQHGVLLLVLNKITIILFWFFSYCFCEVQGGFSTCNRQFNSYFEIYAKVGQNLRKFLNKDNSLNISIQLMELLL